MVATDTLVHNQLLTSECAILTRPDAEGLAEGLVAALTDTALTARWRDGSERALASSAAPSTRDAAYEEIASAVREAAALRRSPNPTRLSDSSQHSSSHRH